MRTVQIHSRSLDRIAQKSVVASHHDDNAAVWPNRHSHAEEQSRRQNITDVYSYIVFCGRKSRHFIYNSVRTIPLTNANGTASAPSFHHSFSFFGSSFRSEMEKKKKKKNMCNSLSGEQRVPYRTAPRTT